MRARPAFVIMLLLTACDGSLGGCSAPIEAPIASDQTIPGAARARVTSDGLSALASHVPWLVAPVVRQACDGAAGAPCVTGQTCACPAGSTCGACPAGNRLCTLSAPPECTQDPGRPALAMRVPRSASDFPDGEPRVRICDTAYGLGFDNCHVFASGFLATVTPASATELGISLAIGLSSPARPNGVKVFYDSGQELWEPSARCTVYGSGLANAEARLRVRHDPSSDRVGLELASVTLPLTRDAFVVEAEAGDDAVRCENAAIDAAIRDLVASHVQQALRSRVEQLLRDALAPLLVDACDPAGPASECPFTTGGTRIACGASGVCGDAPSGIVPALFGIEARLATGGGAPVDLSLRARGPASSISFDASGVTMSWAGAAIAPSSSCAPARTRDTTPIPAITLPAIVDDGAGSTLPYGLGVALHERFLSDVVGEVVESGALCRDVALPVARLDESGLVGLMLAETPELRAVLDATPTVGVVVRPRAAARVELAASPAPLTLVLPEVEVALSAGATTLAVVQADLAIELRPEPGRAGDVHLVGTAPRVLALTVLEPGLLASDASAFEAITPELLAMILPELGALSELELPLPTVLGMRAGPLRFQAIEPIAGETTALGEPRMAFLGAFADVAFGEPPVAAPVDTVARLVQLELPEPVRLSATAGAGRERVRAIVELIFGRDVEHSHRVDGGLWSPYRAGAELIVEDAALSLQGTHRIEVRARVVGAPETRDPEPAELSVVSDVEPPVLSLARDGTWLRVSVRDRVAAADEIAVRVRRDGGAWIELPGGESRELELFAEPITSATLVEAEAIDPAMHVGRASLTIAAEPVDAGAADAGAEADGGITIDDAGSSARDGGAPDAGAETAPTSGCGCRVGAGSSGAGSLGLLVALALLAGGRWMRARRA